MCKFVRKKLPQRLPREPLLLFFAYLLPVTLNFVPDNASLKVVSEMSWFIWTVAFFPSKSTVTVCTPAIAENFSSTVATQPSHFIPSSINSFSIIVSSFLYMIFPYRFETEGLNPFRRNAFNTTDTELKLIAAPAMIGFNKGPPKTCRIPIATGMPRTL